MPPFKKGRVLLGAAWLVGVLAGPRIAGAEEPNIEYGDGPSACRDLVKKNDRELRSWEKQQPSVPYKFPREDDVLGAPWGPFLKSIGHDADLFLATVIPHIGAQYRVDAPAAVIAWPWSIPLGPAFTCSRKVGTFVVDRHDAQRVLLEPGITSGQRGTGIYFRPGYRFMYQPSDWVVGVGPGFGSTLEIHGNKEPFRPSLSPEVVISFGHCCSPGYFTLNLRYDHYFVGDEGDIIGGTLGFVYF